MKTVGILLAAIGALLIQGCGSVGAKVPFAFENIPATEKVVAAAKAKIVVVQELKPGVSCEDVKGTLKIVVKSEQDGKTYQAPVNCSLLPKAFVAQTKVFVPKGEYKVTIYGNSISKFQGRPIATADCQDPNENSGADQDFGGGIVLAENQVHKGKVDAANGKGTSWIQLPSKGGLVSLFLLVDDPASVKASVYVLPKGASVPRKLGALLPKVRRQLRSTDGLLYVHMMGTRYKGEVGFALTRRDSAITKAISVPVLDLYPVNSNSSVVLLSPTQDLKVNDELQISAKKEKGVSVSVGKCVVTSVSDSQVSCKMQAVPSANFTNYKAQLVKEEGNS